MTPEDRILFACVRQEFTSADSETVRALCQQPIQWARVLTRALEHSVAPLVYCNLLKLGRNVGLGDEIAARFNQALWRNIFVREKMAHAFAQVLERFPNEDFLAVKGVALEHSVYAQPWYVRSFDMDLVFKRQRHEFQAEEYAEAIAFFEQVNRNIRSFDQNIEYEFFVHHDLSMNGILPIDFEKVWHNAAPLTLGAHTFFIPSPEDSLLFACINACRKRYFYLKALFNIAEIIAKYPALDWKTFTHNARTSRCNLIVYTALRLTQQTLGAKIPSTALAQLDVGALRQWVIESLCETLLNLGTLDTLFYERGAKIFGRKLGWTLLLTYATYQAEQLVPKIGEIRAGRHGNALQSADVSNLQSKTTPIAVERSRRSIS